MTKELSHYRQLERRLWMARWLRDGGESAEEDAMLDEMESVWLRLSDGEHDLLRREPPRCWPADPSSLPPQLSDIPYLSAPSPWAYEGFHSPAEAIQCLEEP
jgi:hypothetical protein